MKKEDLQLTSDRHSSVEGDSEKSQKPWEPMKLIYTGEAKDVIKGGMGKTSMTTSDPGDSNKPQGQG